MHSGKRYVNNSSTQLVFWWWEETYFYTVLERSALFRSPLVCSFVTSHLSHLRQRKNYYLVLRLVWMFIFGAALPIFIVKLIKKIVKLVFLYFWIS
jgi:hypothetical protein